MLVVIVLAFLLLLLGFAEYAVYQHRLKRIPLRILVNGTRGKTSVTRMIAAIFNEAGISAFAKSTGSQARIILPSGEEIAYRKAGRQPNVLEQKAFVKLADRYRAQAIVVECMAQRIENQLFFGERLIQPHFVVMTNAFVDHQIEIGKSEDETVRVLAQSVPKNAILITEDQRFQRYCPNCVFPKDEASKDQALEIENASFPLHPQNMRLVRCLCEQLHIEATHIRKGIERAKPDIGLYASFLWHGIHIGNGFAANDPNSFGELLSEYADESDYAVLYNHRSDRPYRSAAFMRVLKRCEHPPKSIGIIGDERVQTAAAFEKSTGIPTTAAEDAFSWMEKTGANHVVFAGNIKGDGELLLAELLKENEQHV